MRDVHSYFVSDQEKYPVVNIDLFKDVRFRGNDLDEVYKMS